jgi:hypothetical protein
MDFDFGGNSDVKACTARRVVGPPQAAAMGFHDGAADAKSHAGAVRFGSKEGVEDVIRVLRWEADSRIADRHHNLLVLPSL